jgi:hypothetical protein
MIIPVTVDQLAKDLEDYNQHHNKACRIPSLLRNQRSGWPLLTVSMFSKTMDDKFTPALGGGKCHFFYIAAFNLASLINTVSDKVVVTDGRGVVHASCPSADTVRPFVDCFKIQFTLVGITIEQSSNSYGKLLKTTLQDILDTEDFEGALSSAFRYATKRGCDILSVDQWGQTTYSEKQIKEALNSHAIFYQNQVYVDFGALLNHFDVGDKIIELFENLFKVEQFNNLVKRKKTSLQCFYKEHISDEVTHAGAGSSAQEDSELKMPYLAI